MTNTINKKELVLDYEIVAYRKLEAHNSHLWVNDRSGLFGDGFEIYSVRRLSDGEVFEIGDYVSFQFHDGIMDEEIGSFEIMFAQMLAVSPGGHSKVQISRLKKLNSH